MTERRIEPNNIIKQCDLIVTEDCSLHCKMCHMWKHFREDGKLSLNDYQNFMSSLKEFAGERVQIQFVGGEPLLKREIIELIEHASKKGFSTTMTTNGFLLDKQIREKIGDCGLNTLVLSLESLKEETHDFLRGKQGVYKRIMESIEYFESLADPRLEIFISSIIMKDNLDDLIELAEWVNNNKRISSVYFQAVMQPFGSSADNNWYQDKDHSFLWPDTDKANDVLDELIRLKKNDYKIANQIGQLEIYKSYFRAPGRFIKKTRCNLGYKSFTVLTNGDIYLCLSMPAIGNIKTDRINEVWFSERANKVRRQIANCRQNCKLLINCFFEEEVDINCT